MSALNSLSLVKGSKNQDPELMDLQILYGMGNVYKELNDKQENELFEMNGPC